MKVRALAVQVTPRTTWVFARATGDDGTAGWGEGTLEGRSDEVRAAIEALDGKLGSIPADLVKAAAYSAVEQALWDLKARTEERPLVELLGGAKRRRVALYANINRGTIDRSPAGFAVRAAEAAALGFGAIKIAPFDEVTPNEKDSSARHSPASPRPPRPLPGAPSCRSIATGASMRPRRSRRLPSVHAWA